LYSSSRVTYDEVSDDHCKKEERYTDETGNFDAAPHRLDPLSTQHPENDHEGVQEIAEMPAGECTADFDSYGYKNGDYW
jgi:hypothetical protein